MHWSADLAFRLLTIKHQTDNRTQSSSSSTPNDSSKGIKSDSNNNNSSSSRSLIDAVDWSHWLACLPDQVITPVQFSEEEVQHLGLTSTVEVCC